MPSVTTDTTEATQTRVDQAQEGVKAPLSQRALKRVRIAERRLAKQRRRHPIPQGCSKPR